MAKTTWTKAQVEELVKRENLAYQKIELPHGVTTAGKDRSGTSAKIFAGGIQGKSVLDIGCFLGYFCHEAIRRGAGRVVGIDVDENRLRQARLIADCLGMDIEFKLLDIEQEEPPGQFDVILMLNVFHHFRNPIAVLDKVIPHTKECLILEMASPRSPKARKLLKSMGASWWTRRRLERLPLIVAGRDWQVIRGNEQKFFFSFPALEHVLMYQRGAFSKLDFMNSSFKDRYIAMAWKIRVGRLIIISGATASGKSTLIRQLIQRELPEIATAIDMGGGLDRACLRPKDMLKRDPGKIDNLVFHYDLLRTFGTDSNTYAKEQGTDIIDCADQRTVVTLWCDPKVMCQRQEPKLARVKRHWHRRRIKNVLALYQNGKQLAGYYEKWVAYSRHKRAKIFFVDCTDKPRLLTNLEWKKKIETLK